MPSFISTATSSTSHPSSANHDNLILGPMQLPLPIVPVYNPVNTCLLNIRSLNTKSFFAKTSLPLISWTFFYHYRDMVTSRRLLSSYWSNPAFINPISKILQNSYLKWIQITCCCQYQTFVNDFKDTLKSFNLIHSRTDTLKESHSWPVSVLSAVNPEIKDIWVSHKTVL